MASQDFGFFSYLHSIDLPVLQHNVSIFFTRLWSVRKAMLFRYMGGLVTNQQKCFSLSSLYFCLIIYMHTQ